MNFVQSSTKISRFAFNAKFFSNYLIGPIFAKIAGMVELCPVDEWSEVIFSIS